MVDVEDRYVEVLTPLPRPRPRQIGASPYGRGMSCLFDGPRGAEVRTGQHAENMAVKVRYVMEGNGPAVLLVHGLGASLAVWGENIAPLAEEGRTVYALDLPGYGKSDKPRELDYDAVSGAHFLVRFMDTLGIKSATIIGNSAGGIVSAMCALIYPHRVERLVLVDAPGLARPMAWFLRFASLPLLGELLHIPDVHDPRNMIKSVFYEPKAVSDDLVDELMHVRNFRGSKMAALRSIRSGTSLWGLRKKMLVLHRLKGFAKPLLVIWGREDRIIPVSHACRAAEVLSPNCTVHIIPYCGHWPQLERPEEFNLLVLDFLKRE